jgi:hypothetical protein
MTALTKAAPCIALVLGLATAPAIAMPAYPLSLPQESAYQLAAAEKASSKVEATKSWLKTKKAQTTRWMGRQKQKLKQLAD